MLVRMANRIRKPLTDAQKAAHREAQARYSKTDKGRAVQYASTRRYRDTEEGRARRRAEIARSRVANAIRWDARRAVYEAVRRGEMVKSPCHCGEVRVEGHHHMGYEPEHWLSVQWLCRAHHREAHG